MINSKGIYNINTECYTRKLKCAVKFGKLLHLIGCIMEMNFMVHVCNMFYSRYNNIIHVISNNYYYFIVEPNFKDTNPFINCYSTIGMNKSLEV